MKKIVRMQRWGLVGLLCLMLAAVLVLPQTVSAAAPPAIISFTPISGGTGTVVVINGTNLTGATAVTFGGTNASTFNVTSDNSITAVVGNGSTGNVSVSTPGGTNSSSDTFTYVAAPAIISFTPISGGTGTVVVINGTNLTGATAVSFGGTAASFIVANTSIWAMVGTGSTGNVSVTTPGGTAHSIGAFTYVAAVPTVTSFTPSSGGMGTVVVINGTNFTGATAVSFGGTAAASFMVVSDTSIRAMVGTGTTGTVSVTTPGGTAHSSGTFIFVPAPTVSSFTPSSGGTGTSVTINGTGFYGGGSSPAVSAVTFGGTEASSFTVNSDTLITGVVGTGSTGNVSVTTPGGTAHSSGTFTYVAAAPTVSSFTPSSGGTGTSVTINGTGFYGGGSSPAVSAVTFGNTAAASFIAVSDTLITGVVGTGSTGNVSVTTPGGTAHSSGTFTYVAAAPTVSSFTPSSGGTGTLVAINGTSFTGATAVTFGNTAAASFIAVSDTLITAVVGTGSTGNVSVTTPSGTAHSSGTFTYVAAAPIVTSFTPSSGGKNTSVAISGTSFTGATAVRFGDSNASSFTVNSDTLITAVVGTGSTGNISVTTSSGTAHSSGTFTFTNSWLWWYWALIGVVAAFIIVIAIISLLVHLRKGKGQEIAAESLYGEEPEEFRF